MRKLQLQTLVMVNLYIKRLNLRMHIWVISIANDLISNFNSKEGFVHVTIVDMLISFHYIFVAMFRLVDLSAYEATTSVEN